MKTVSTHVFGHGVPTAPDVELLVKQYGIPIEGVPIPYSDVTKLINVEYGTHRFSSVTHAWRRHLYTKHNVATYCEDKCFIAASPDNRVNMGCGKIRSGVKAIRRSGVLLATSDRPRMSPDKQRLSDHYLHLAGQIQQMALVTAKTMTPPEIAVKKKE